MPPLDGSAPGRETPKRAGTHRQRSPTGAPPATRGRVLVLFSMVTILLSLGCRSTLEASDAGISDNRAWHCWTLDAAECHDTLASYCADLPRCWTFDETLAALSTSCFEIWRDYGGGVTVGKAGPWRYIRDGKAGEFFRTQYFDTDGNLVAVDVTSNPPFACSGAYDTIHDKYWGDPTRCDVETQEKIVCLCDM